MAYNGVGLSEITTYLNDNNIKTPSSLKRKNPNSKAKYNPMWTISSVKKIYLLCNKVLMQYRQYREFMLQFYC